MLKHTPLHRTHNLTRKYGDKFLNTQENMKKNRKRARGKITDYRVQSTDYRVQITEQRLQSTEYRLQITVMKEILRFAQDELC